MNTIKKNETPIIKKKEKKTFIRFQMTPNLFALAKSNDPQFVSNLPNRSPKIFLFYFFHLSFYVFPSSSP